MTANRGEKGALKSTSAPPMALEHRPLAWFRPYDRNPVKNDAAVGDMAALIREFGFRVPMLARSSGEVVDGHLRLKAAELVGLGELPVILCDDWTEAQVKAFRLASRNSAAWAEWDDGLVALELTDLAGMGFDLRLTGFGQKELDTMMGGALGTDGGGTGEQLGGVVYQIIVSCATEQEQAALCERLEREGLKCRLLTL